MFFSESLDLLCIADTDGYFRQLNPHWEEALGLLRSHELTSRRFMDFVHPDDLGCHRRRDGRTGRSGSPQLQFMNRYQHQGSGAYRWLEWRAFPRGELDLRRRARPHRSHRGGAGDQRQRGPLPPHGRQHRRRHLDPRSRRRCRFTYVSSFRRTPARLHGSARSLDQSIDRGPHARIARPRDEWPALLPPAIAAFEAGDESCAHQRRPRSTSRARTAAWCRPR